MATASDVGGDMAVNAANSAVQFGFNQLAANNAWDRQKDAWTKGPRYARMGLEAAGMNPLLASGIGSSVMGARGVTQAPVGRGQTDYSKLSKLQPEKKLIAKQVDATQAQAGAADAAARSSDATAAKTQTENELAKTALAPAQLRQAAQMSPLGRQAIMRGELNGLAANAAPTPASLLGTTTLGAEKAVRDTMKAITEYFKERENPPTFQDKHNTPPINVRPRTQ